MPRTGFKRQLKKTINLDDDFTTNETEVINFSPLLSINFKLLRSLSLSGSYSLVKENNEKYNPSTGDIDTEKKSIRKTLAISSQYSFSAPGGISIPLFGKLKFKSTMKIELNVKMVSDYRVAGRTPTITSGIRKVMFENLESGPK